MIKQPLRVLLVEDSADIRCIVETFLSQNYSYLVDAAGDIEKAWDLVIRAERPYHVALIDHLLPPGAERNPEPLGIQLLRRIKAHSPLTEAVIFTAYGMEPALEALRAGAFRCLAKPINLDELAIILLQAA